MYSNYLYEPKDNENNGLQNIFMFVSHVTYVSLTFKVYLSFFPSKFDFFG